MAASNRPHDGDLIEQASVQSEPEPQEASEAETLEPSGLHIGPEHFAQFHQDHPEELESYARDLEPQGGSSDPFESSFRDFLKRSDERGLPPGFLSRLKQEAHSHKSSSNDADQALEGLNEVAEALQAKGGQADPAEIVAKLPMTGPVEIPSLGSKSPSRARLLLWGAAAFGLAWALYAWLT